MRSSEGSWETKEKGIQMFMNVCVLEGEALSNDASYTSKNDSNFGWKMEMQAPSYYPMQA